MLTAPLTIAVTVLVETGLKSNPTWSVTGEVVKLKTFLNSLVLILRIELSLAKSMVFKFWSSVADNEGNLKFLFWSSICEDNLTISCSFAVYDVLIEFTACLKVRSCLSIYWYS